MPNIYLCSNLWIINLWITGFGLVSLVSVLSPSIAIAQPRPAPADIRPDLPTPAPPPVRPQPLPDVPVPLLPDEQPVVPVPAGDLSSLPTCLLPLSPLPLPERENPVAAADTILVRQFQVIGSTVFSCEDLETALAPYFNRSLSFVELLEARSAITQLYLEADYITSGAYLPGEQRLDEAGAVVLIQVIEGRVADIRVSGTERLSPAYVRSRLQRGIGTPLNQNELLDALRLLQVNPLIASVAAELSSGIEPGTNLLDVQVTEADPFSVQFVSNNGRSPSVGSFRRGARLTHANVFGLGDGLSIGYNNTDGSNSLDINYTVPWNSLDGTISLNYGRERNTVIEPFFEEFQIDTDADYYQIALRQPLYRTPIKEFALSLIAAHTDSQSTLDGQPTPLSPGSDGTGRTRITALRFAQDWVQQHQRTVLAARSQFSLGIDALNATINEQAPDSRFFSWLGQVQWVQLLEQSSGNPSLAPLLLLQTNVQLADQTLVPVEQFGIGGLGSVRGYRQDALLTDNSVFATAEARLPVLRIPQWETALLLIPFTEVGTGWNNGLVPDPSPGTLASVGLGLQLLQSDRLSARLDWGIPLVQLEDGDRTWQENGIYFSLEFNPF